MQLDSIKTVLDLAAKEHGAELDRIKSIDAKTGPLLGGTTAAIAIVAGLLSKPDLFSVAGGVRAGILLALLCFVAAHFCFLRAVKVRTYQTFDLAVWNTPATMQTDPAEVLWELISTYEEMLAANARVRNQKAAAHEWGVRLLSVGIWVLAFAFWLNGALSTTE